MKKTLLMLGALLVLAASIVLTRQRVGGTVGKFPASRAAELAPPDTVAYLEVADVDRALARWAQSEISAIAKDPAIQPEMWEHLRFEMARHFFGDRETTQSILRVLAEPRKEEPAGFFLAATDLAAEPYPKAVGGFPYRGKKSDVESALRALKQHLGGAWTGFKSELSDHRGIQIETLTGTVALPPPAIVTIYIPDPPTRPFPWGGGRVYKYKPAGRPPATVPPAALHLAYRDDWLFFATDRALLAATLDRYLGQPGAAKGLAANPDFMACRKHEVPEADLALWLRWEPAGRQFSEDRLPFYFADWDDSENPRRALHYSLRFDGAVRERRYFQLTQPPAVPPAIAPGNQFIQPDARAVLMFSFDALRPQAKRLSALARSDSWSLLDQALREKRLGINDLWAAFGPEATITFFDREQRSAQSLVAAVSIRDPGKARAFTDAFATGGWRVYRAQTDAQTNYWEWESDHGEAFDLRPRLDWVGQNSKRMTLALTPTHFLFGTSPERVRALSKQLDRSSTPTAPPPVEAKALLRQAESSAGGLAYFEPATFVAASLSIEQRAAAPIVTALAKHLSPGTIHFRPEGAGWLEESTLSIPARYLFDRLLEPPTPY